jgi:hypothetical protein
VKAFILTDWNFYNNKGSLICTHNLKGGLCEYPDKLKIIFQIQKNRQNGQFITLVANDAHLEKSPVQAAYRIFIQAKRLDQSDSEPLAVFVNKNGITNYLTGNKISDILQSIARMVHPGLSEDEIKCFFPHLGRVWALVLLDEADTTPDFMKSCLH